MQDYEMISVFSNGKKDEKRCRYFGKCLPSKHGQMGPIWAESGHYAQNGPMWVPYRNFSPCGTHMRPI